MKFVLEIECNNAAFDDDAMTGEVARILHVVAGQVKADVRDRLSIRDINGATVGWAEFTDS